MPHFCPWSDFPIIGASHSLKTSFLKSDTPESLKNVESHATSYKNTDCKYFYYLQQFLMNLRILWETCYFAIIASLLHITVSWWKFIQHVKKKKEKVILHLIFYSVTLSAFWKEQVHSSDITKLVPTLCPWSRQQNRRGGISKVWRMHSVSVCKFCKERKAAVNFIIIKDLKMVLMMTTMDEIRESQSRFQFFLVIFNFTLNLRAPPSMKN